MTLTEQWKKGELPLGMYYVKMPLGVEILSDYSLYKYKLTRDDDSIEVLAPAPSYEEWQKVLNIDFNNEVLRLENQQLKELLKECKPYVTRNVVFATVNRAEVVDLEKNELLTKIDNAIGANNDKK